VNIDLMYGLPQQTEKQARADLEEGLGFGTPHLSAYQLTIEPNTVFHSKRPPLPEHDACADMQAMVEDSLSRGGFQHYETSAFARPGFRCRHNLNYWEFGDYLGIGAGAHGKLSFADRITRHEQVKQPRDYLRASPAENRLVAPKEVAFEFMLNALRLLDGFPVDLFPARTGLPAVTIEAKLKDAEEKGLLERSSGRIRPTERGRRFLNDLTALFLPAHE
jgi:oxygen-independent coproporphyrinogen-3 oxidase